MIKRILRRILSFRLFWLLSDECYLKLKYRIETGHILNLADPKGFSEKIQWLKLNNRIEDMPDRVDKAKAKEYAISVIGEEHVAKSLGLFEHLADLDLLALPEHCVIKCTHDSGSTFFYDRNNVASDDLLCFLKRRMESNYYFAGREWPYKSIQPRVLVEEILPTSDEAYDLKFLCFAGVPKVAIRYGNREMSYYDMNWNKFLCHHSKNQRSPDYARPACFSELKKSAGLLAATYPFVRVDFVVDGMKYWFSEMTFFPSSGFSLILPEEYELLFGSWI